MMHHLVHRAVSPRTGGRTLAVRRSPGEHVHMAATDYSFNYVECDIPDGMTLAQWRRRHLPATPAPRRSRLSRLLRRG